jgi:hypothetical protein
MKHAANLLFCFAVALFLTGCGKDTLDLQKETTIESPQDYGIGNFTVVRFEPNARKVRIVWRAYNAFHGNAFHVPWEEVEASSDLEKYIVTDKTTGNDALQVNGKLYKFNGSKDCVLVKFGEGVSIVPGIPYEDAKRIGKDF